MMMHQLFRITASALLILWGGMAWGQTEGDALRYSRSTVIGTARSQGMGGAFSAVGADMTAATLNPAGLGFYNTNQVTLSPQLRIINIKSEYLDADGKDQLSRAGVPGFGVVFSQDVMVGIGGERRKASSGLIRFSFAFGMNQIDQYDGRQKASGWNPYSSVTDVFSESAQGTFPENLPIDSPEEMAYWIFGIDTVVGGDGATYFPAVNDGRIQQSVQRDEKGRMNEWFISVAGNINDMIFLGATIGIRNLQYEQVLSLREEDTQNLHRFFQPDPGSPFPLETPFEQLIYTERYDTRGSGVNGKFGIIIRPVDAFRFGISLQTPTVLRLTDNFDSDLSHRFEILLPNGDPGSEELFRSAPPASFEYKLSTPFQTTFGAAYFFGKRGFITMDVDLIDYRSAQYKNIGGLNDPNAVDYSDVNGSIGNLYKMTTNLRIGGEIRLDPFRLRGGVALFGSPLSETGAAYQDFRDNFALKQLNASRRAFSVGFGYRQPIFFADVSYVNQRENDKFSPYLGSSDQTFYPTFLYSKTTHSILATVGMNF